MCCFCHAQLFEITRAKNIKSPLVQPSCQNAEVVQAFYRVTASRSNTPMLASRLPSRAAPALNPDSARCLAGAQLPATSFFGGFRTPAPVQAAPSRWAGIRNPAQKLTHAPQQTVSERCCPRDCVAVLATADSRPANATTKSQHSQRIRKQDRRQLARNTSACRSELRRVCRNQRIPGSASKR